MKSNLFGTGNNYFAPVCLRCTFFTQTGLIVSHVPLCNGKTYDQRVTELETGEW